MELLDLDVANEVLNGISILVVSLALFFLGVILGIQSRKATDDGTATFLALVTLAAYLGGAASVFFGMKRIHRAELAEYLHHEWIDKARAQHAEDGR